MQHAVGVAQQGLCLCVAAQACRSAGLRRGSVEAGQVLRGGPEGAEERQSQPAATLTLGRAYGSASELRLRPPGIVTQDQAVVQEETAVRSTYVADESSYELVKLHNLKTRMPLQRHQRVWSTGFALV